MTLIDWLLLAYIVAAGTPIVWLFVELFFEIVEREDND